MFIQSQSRASRIRSARRISSLDTLGGGGGRECRLFVFVSVANLLNFLMDSYLSMRVRDWLIVFLQCGTYLDSLCYGLHDLGTWLVGQQLLLGRHNLDLLGGLGQRGLVVRSRGVVVVGFGATDSDDARHRLSR